MFNDQEFLKSLEGHVGKEYFLRMNKGFYTEPFNSSGTGPDYYGWGESYCINSNSDDWNTTTKITACQVVIFREEQPDETIRFVSFHIHPNQIGFCSDQTKQFIENKLTQAGMSTNADYILVTPDAVNSGEGDPIQSRREQFIEKVNPNGKCLQHIQLGEGVWKNKPSVIYDIYFSPKREALVAAEYPWSYSRNMQSPDTKVILYEDVFSNPKPSRLYSQEKIATHADDVAIQENTVTQCISQYMPSFSFSEALSSCFCWGSRPDADDKRNQNEDDLLLEGDNVLHLK